MKVTVSLPRVRVARHQVGCARIVRLLDGGRQAFTRKTQISSCQLPNGFALANDRSILKPKHRADGEGERQPINRALNIPDHWRRIRTMTTSGFSMDVA